MANPNQIFNSVTFKAPRRSMQRLWNTYKSSTDFGKIIPIGLWEIAPGDVMKKNTNVFLRSLALLAPMLHEVDIYVHDFFVPWRLIWEDYEKFLIPQDGETAETIPSKPYFPLSSGSSNKAAIYALWKEGSLADYFGLPLFSQASDVPTVNNEDIRICSLPFRAYALCWNEYYRDQNLQDPIDFKTGSGSETALYSAGIKAYQTLCPLRYRAWEKDYFTSALPRPQKGEPMGIDIKGLAGTRMPVILDNSGDDASQLIKTVNGEVTSDALGSDQGIFQDDPTAATPKNAFLDPNGTLFAIPQEGSNMGYFTIEMLREMMRLQEFMEQLMRGGSRYAEVVRNMFGQVPDDLRIGRPAYLGGSRQSLVISEVLQQSQSVSADQSINTSSLGDMGGHGISFGGSTHWKALFKEHGYVISLLSIRPRAAYMQGVNKLWLKNDRYEEMWPLFAHLGEQPVMNGELYWSWTDGKNRDTFGYQPIYTEYRTKPSIVTGALRSSLDYWHLNRKFASRPSLNSDFITVQPSDCERIFATSSALGDHLLFEATNDVKFIRCIPRDGNPTL